VQAGSEQSGGQRVHFAGLNSLRFFAAFFVVLDHIPMNQGSAGIPNPSYGTIFFRGSFAVCFFFALSGFLITYLLLDETRRTGTLRVRNFYLRRICRIWPLYGAVVAFGLFCYNALLPRLGVRYPVGYPLTEAIVLYAALLPNLMNSLYAVGGILNPAWSIGVEEQFYLVWAPTMKRVRERFPLLCWGVLVGSLTLFCFAHYDLLGVGWSKRFFEQLKFHFMAGGALMAWWLTARRENLLRLPLFASRWVQAALLALLADLYLTSFVPWNWLGYELAQLLLYCWLIVEVAANPCSLLPVSNRALDHLGGVSYGIYMLHMPAIYATSALFQRTSWWHSRGIALYLLSYYTAVFGLTLLLAEVSYRFYERPFLRLKESRFTAVRSSPGEESAQRIGKDEAASH
jgi:peptidoglycan/LPS O-acetylase OafA/YrhL